ncbi:hypothetical protein PROFUN_09973 [Planoprotostelium fungivorum]|uniref:asparagine--tRNA ligase n=1 Tax=Planoprotostelium fungivorum TaxID=1890364 RepID=A0A2P6NFK2_9EUKA|nr:hypothetical protein PROFUN_09973 [Planoprotostelium fungivorum]
MSQPRFDASVSIITAQRKQKEEETQVAVGKTFSKWCHHRTTRRGLNITDVFTDFRSGVSLILLFEEVTQKSLEATLGQKYNAKPTLEIQCIENIAIALQFFQKVTGSNLNINPKDIVDGNKKVILGLVWRMITSGMLSPEQSNTDAAQRNRQAKSNLLNWVKLQLQEYPDIPVNDFETSFSDGRIFSALLHKHTSSIIDPKKLTGDATSDLTLAFQLAERHLGIPQLVDASVMSRPPVDEKIVMTYVAEYPLAFIRNPPNANLTNLASQPLPPPVTDDVLEAPTLTLSFEDEKRMREDFVRRNPMPLVAQRREGPSQMERELLEEFDRICTTAERFKNEIPMLKKYNQEMEAYNQQVAYMRGKQQEDERNAIYREQMKIQKEIQMLQEDNDRLLKELYKKRGDLVGTLTVTVNEGKDIKQKLKYGGGTLDSFVTVRLDKQLFTTRTIKKSSSPNWSQTFVLYVSKHHKAIEVTVWDDHVVAKAGFRGQAVIPVETFAASPRGELPVVSFSRECKVDTCGLFLAAVTAADTLHNHMVAPNGAAEDGSNVIPTEAKNLAAFQVIVKALGDGQISQTHKKLIKLHEGILRTHRSEKDLTEQSNNLKEELNNQKEHIKKASTQSFEDNITIANARKDLAKWQSDLANALEREEWEKAEVMGLEKKKQELSDFAELERTRKEEELEPQIHILKLNQKDLMDELTYQRTLIEKQDAERIEVTQKITKAEQERSELEMAIGQLRQEFSHIRSDPDKYRKQADVVQTALKALRSESDRLSTAVTELDTELANMNKSRKENLDLSMNLAMQLDKHKNAIEMKERQIAQILKDSEREKLRHQTELETRSISDTQLRRSLFTIRRKNEEAMGKERELNNALKSVRKAKVALESAKKSIPELTNTIEEMRRQMGKEEEITKRHHSKLEDLRYDRDVLINNFLRLEDIEKGKSEVVKVLAQENVDLEEELDKLMKQEQIISREITELGIDRDVKRNEAVRAANTLDKAKLELKLRGLLIVDLEKAATDTDTHLKKFEGMYEIVKNERNKYTNLLQATQLLGYELSEKIKVLQNEIDILKSEVETKEAALAVEKTHYLGICAERDTVRGDINKQTYRCQLKEEAVDQGMAEIRKLNSIIRSAENDILYLRKRYEGALQNLNATGTLIVQKNEQLYLLYDRTHSQETIQHNGDIELKKREEEIRMLHLHKAELEREITVTRKGENSIPKLEKEKEELFYLLREKKKEVRKLSKELESPENVVRWRSLEGEDPSAEALNDKIKALEQKIAEGQAKVLEKELVLTEAKSLEEKYTHQIDSQKEGALKLSSKVNACKTKMKEHNKKIMSLVAQISLNQSVQAQLQREKSILSEEVKSAEARIQAGQPPTIEMEEKWNITQQRESLRKQEEQVHRENEEVIREHTLSDGTITQADRRVTMYIPEGDKLGIPKPYGAYAPLKPSDSGASLLPNIVCSPSGAYYRILPQWDRSEETMSDSSDVAALQERIKQLELENEKLQKQVSANPSFKVSGPTKFHRRILVKTLLKNPVEGEEIVLCGWARTIREQGGGRFAFLELVDGSSASSFQVVVMAETPGFAELTGPDAGIHACFVVEGKVVKGKGKQPFELAATNVELHGKCVPGTYPLAKSKDRPSMEYLREIAHLRGRTNTFSNMVRVRNACSMATHLFFQSQNFIYLNTPLITTSDCEGAGEMFQVTTLLKNGTAKMSDVIAAKDGQPDYTKDFFGKPAFLTVSGQLNGEMYASAVGRIYTFGPTFRAEVSHTKRHMSEFWMIEPEIAFADLDENMDIAEAYLKFVLKHVRETCPEELAFFNSFVEKGLIERLKNVEEKPFKKMSYTEAVQVLLDSKQKFETPVSWGIDLGSEHERYLTDVVYKQPVILYNYPKDIKAFYMRLNDDGKTVRAMDVLVPKIGELMGGSQREERLEHLEQRIDELKLDKHAYRHYLDLRRFGTCQHSGFGLGFERLVMFVTGIENIRDAIPFPRVPGSAEF